MSDIKDGLKDSEPVDGMKSSEKLDALEVRRDLQFHYKGLFLSHINMANACTLFEVAL